MQISTEDDALGIDPNHPWAHRFTVIRYADGAVSLIPNGFFKNWLDEEAGEHNFFIGRCSGLGTGSEVKYDSNQQCLRVGRFVSGGQRLRFILNGQHETRCLSTYMFSILGPNFRNLPPPQYADTVIKNDVWIGDEAMVLGGSCIENGCIIGARSLLPPNFQSVPYGIYAGSPARLIRLRFPDRVIEELLSLRWWEKPLAWIEKYNEAFLQDLSIDEGRSLEILAELRTVI